MAVFLDAIQGLGMYPLDSAKTPVDFLAADGHKWLLGPEGAGVAMIRREHIDLFAVGMSAGAASRIRSTMRRRNWSCERSGAIRGRIGEHDRCDSLGSEPRYVSEIRQQHGELAIGKRVVELIETLDSMLRGKGVITRLPKSPENRSGILTFDVPGVDPIEFRKRALEKKVVVSCRDGGVRASVHAYNDAEILPDSSTLSDRSASRSTSHHPSRFHFQAVLMPSYTHRRLHRFVRPDHAWAFAHHPAQRVTGRSTGDRSRIQCR